MSKYLKYLILEGIDQKNYKTYDFSKLDLDQQIQYLDSFFKDQNIKTNAKNKNGNIEITFENNKEAEKAIQNFSKITGLKAKNNIFSIGNKHFVFGSIKNNLKNSNYKKGK